MNITVHRTPRSLIDQPPLLLAPGSLVELWQAPLHEGPHPDDATDDRERLLGWVVGTDVHTNNPDFIWGYDLRACYEDFEGTIWEYDVTVRSVKRVLQVADWPDAY